MDPDSVVTFLKLLDDLRKLYMENLGKRVVLARAGDAVLDAVAEIADWSGGDITLLTLVIAGKLSYEALIERLCSVRGISYVLPAERRASSTVTVSDSEKGLSLFSPPIYLGEKQDAEFLSEKGQMISARTISTLAVLVGIQYEYGIDITSNLYNNDFFKHYRHFGDL